MSKQGIRELVTKLTKAWREGSFAELAELFHPDAVIVAPGMRERSDGRKECVESYRKFTASAKVLSYIESDLSIDVWGDSAMAAYHFDMEWDAAGARSRESGHDVLMLVREHGKWLIAWRTQVPAARAPG